MSVVSETPAGNDRLAQLIAKAQAMTLLSVAYDLVIQTAVSEQNYLKAAEHYYSNAREHCLLHEIDFDEIARLPQIGRSDAERYCSIAGVSLDDILS